VCCVIFVRWWSSIIGYLTDLARPSVSQYLAPVLEALRTVLAIFGYCEAFSVQRSTYVFENVLGLIENSTHPDQEVLTALVRSLLYKVHRTYIPYGLNMSYRYYTYR
jgi:hypothetical protein